MEYLILKYLHILTATILFGTGMGTAFFMLMAYLSKDIATLKQTTKYVVLADWIFTTPAVILQPITGIRLMMILHYPFNTLWFVSIIGLYLLIGMCWIPVVFIQYKLRAIVQNVNNNEALPQKYHTLMRWWVSLGIPAFLSILIIYWMMVSKNGLSITIL
jgi:uncharacterized membrane protein